MGTDIHLYVEVKDADGAWHLQIPPEPPPDVGRDWWPRDAPGGGYFWMAPCYTCYGNDPGCAACLGSGRDLRWYHARNYTVFYILTGMIRPRGGNPRPIVPAPRGEPMDMSDALRHNDRRWDHSPSWLTLDEILAYPWAGIEHISGFVHFFQHWLVPLSDDPTRVRLVFGFDS